MLGSVIYCRISSSIIVLNRFFFDWNINFLYNSWQIFCMWQVKCICETCTWSILIDCSAMALSCALHAETPIHRVIHFSTKFGYFLSQKPHCYLIKILTASFSFGKLFKNSLRAATRFFRFSKKISCYFLKDCVNKRPRSICFIVQLFASDLIKSNRIITVTDVLSWQA